jgi:hypothetical protein
MPLRDHFRSPVNDRHTWDELHGMWPMMIVRQLFDVLPAGFRAAPKVQRGSSFEDDASTSALDTRQPTASDSGAGDGPTHSVEADLSEQDDYEVRIYDTEQGRQLVATIEIVSPSNKDRPESRDLFVGKVAALLQQNVCVSLVDLVTVRQANLYAELLTRVGRHDPALAPVPPDLYAVTLRTRKPPKRRAVLDAWFYPMTIGQVLPPIPIWLDPDVGVPVPLESSYEQTCRLLHIA